MPQPSPRTYYRNVYVTSGPNQEVLGILCTDRKMSALMRYRVCKYLLVIRLKP